jgi:hypothetical protein
MVEVQMNLFSLLRGQRSPFDVTCLISYLTAIIRVSRNTKMQRNNEETKIVGKCIYSIC